VDRVLCDAAALVHPDAVAVEALARLQLAARRVGRRIHLLHACPELRDLIALMGLHEVFRLPGPLPVEGGGQAEEGEPARRVEEERDPGDPPG
jgi:anti-anti-sigma regulatory factor